VDRNGQPPVVADSLKGFARIQKEYTEHLLYTNNRLLQLIDHILLNSAKPPVILLAGDHGFRQFSKETDHKYYFMNLVFSCPGATIPVFMMGCPLSIHSG
jgi:hypothetical protein